MAWLKVKSAARHSDLSVRTMRELLKQGLPHTRLPSGTILIEANQLDSWLRGFDATRQGDQLVDELLEGLKL